MSVGVTFARGFVAAGLAAGFKPSGRPDLAMLVGAPGTTAAGVFTTNRAEAAPVTLARRRLATTGGRARVVLVNSGQANAATGARGLADAEATTASAAELLDVEPDAVLPCSTGVIGEPLHVEDFLRALPGLAGALSEEGGDAFARAIMTTDSVPKTASAEAGGFRVGGAAKGVGMIAPSLATMLAFVTTDAPVVPADLDRLVRETLRPRFEAITVDGCPSTNDVVLLLASGAAGGDPVVPGTPSWAHLEGAVDAVGGDLAGQLIRDGEGATHVVLVEVVGAADDADARAVAKAVADSPLVKTAAFGGDPNPGRILQAVGAAGAALDAAAVDVRIGDADVVVGGVIPPAYFEDGGSLREVAAKAMAEPEWTLHVRVGPGPGRSRVLACDLSYDYVRINGEYTT